MRRGRSLAVSRFRHISIERGARKDDVGTDREPERVVADDRYLDEHAEDRDDNHKERSDKTKVHGLYLPV